MSYKIDKHKLWLYSALLTVSLVQGEIYSEWKNKASIVLNTSSDGANVPGTVRQFPLLLRLDSSNFDFSTAPNQGNDLRFSNSEGKALPYQIERWNESVSRAEIWVLVDSIVGNSKAQSILMHWGNANATDSSNGPAVFDSANGFVAAWHLGGKDSTARKNSVAGGNDALPGNYDGDESTLGMIGLADSLDGDSLGNYLNLGAGYADFHNGFTFSVWSYPTAQKKYSRLLDLGNNKETNNIILSRFNATKNIHFYSWTTNVSPAKKIISDSTYLINQWHFYTGTITDSTYILYKDGKEINRLTYGGLVTNILRTTCFLGKSNWPNDQYYQGIIDEAVLSKVTRSPDWIKLSYENQVPSQRLVSITQSNPCQKKISVPANLALPEATEINLMGIAECAQEVYWKSISGPTPLILNPETHDLRIILPRVSNDTDLIYQFNFNYQNVWDSLTVKLRLLNTIPDPIFSFPKFPVWNGFDTLRVTPLISNLKEIEASREPHIEYQWQIGEADADTAWGSHYLLLKNAPSEGNLRIGLCLSNNGPWVCDTTMISVMKPVGLKKSTVLAKPSKISQAFDARGRSKPTKLIRKYSRKN